MEETDELANGTVRSLFWMTPSLFRNLWAGAGDGGPVGRAVVRGRGDQHLRSVVNKVHASFGFALGIAREGGRRTEWMAMAPI